MKTAVNLALTFVMLALCGTLIAAVLDWRPEDSDAAVAPEAVELDVEAARSEEALEEKPPADEGDEVPEASIEGEWKTIPEGYDPRADEWPGASLGFVGPNGEGALDSASYEDDAAYNAALAELDNGWENVVPSVLAEDDPKPSYGYAAGQLNIGFDGSLSEYDAHLIVEGEGGIWIEDCYQFSNVPQSSQHASAWFPDCADYESLMAKAEALEAYEGVLSAGINAREAFDEDAEGVAATQSVLYVMSERDGLGSLAEPRPI